MQQLFVCGANGAPVAAALRRYTSSFEFPQVHLKQQQHLQGQKHNVSRACEAQKAKHSFDHGGSHACRQRLTSQSHRDGRLLQQHTGHRTYYAQSHAYTLEGSSDGQAVLADVLATAQSQSSNRKGVRPPAPHPQQSKAVGMASDCCPTDFELKSQS